MESIDIDDEAARQVDEESSGFHHRELAGSEEISVDELAVNVD